MSSQTNSSLFQPINLLHQAASSIITKNLQESFNPDQHLGFNQVITNIWDELKRSPRELTLQQDSALECAMSKIQASHEKLLTEKMYVLFQKLAEEFQSKEFFGDRIPVDFPSYDHIQKAWEDDALLKIWGSVSEAFTFDGPAPASLSEIKGWLSNPANAEQLDTIQNLDLQNLQLKAIPPEITKFTELQSLDVGDNKIRIIPDFLGKLTQLQSLYLHNNLIENIPDSLAGLTQLDMLDLSNNQIRHVPDSLASLAKLFSLNLSFNPISNIPDSLTGLTQLMIYTFGVKLDASCSSVVIKDYAELRLAMQEYL